MKKNLLILLLAGVFVAPALADKPERTGKDKLTDEQKAAHQTSIEAKEGLSNSDKFKEKPGEADKLKGLEKQKSKKSEQVQKEFDKGSDKGKEARESNSKKWWKFWGE